MSRKVPIKRQVFKCVVTRYYLLMNYIIPIYVDSGIGSMGRTSLINGSFAKKQKFLNMINCII
jgi:hypothetical protein